MRALLRRARRADLAERAAGAARARRRRRRPLRARPAALPAGDRGDRQPPHDELVRRARADARSGPRSSTRTPSPDEALDRLWEAIAHVCRLDEDDPVAAWTERMATLKRSATRADRAALRRDPPPRPRHRPHRRPVPVVDLARGRVHDRRRARALSRTSRARRRSRRPTRCGSTATSARRCRSSCTARSSEGIRVEFEGGRAVKIDADENAETLRAACTKDDGASRLGELALVDGGGRIGPLETVFFDTLLDENAASHIALGSAYALAVDGRGREAARSTRARSTSTS